jgi:hypothetical protein
MLDLVQSLVPTHCICNGYLSSPPKDAIYNIPAKENINFYLFENIGCLDNFLLWAHYVVKFVSWLWNIIDKCGLLADWNCIDGIMVNVLTSSAAVRWFETWSGKTKDYKIGICCFSSNYVALSSKSNNSLARNQNNVSEWSDNGLLCQCSSSINIQLSLFFFLCRYTVLLQDVEDYVLLHAWVFKKNIYINFMKVK